MNLKKEKVVNSCGFIAALALSLHLIGLIPAFSQPQGGGRCGDGVCDSVEKSNNRCPRDCKDSSSERGNDSCDFNNDGRVDDIEKRVCGGAEDSVKSGPSAVSDLGVSQEGSSSRLKTAKSGSLGEISFHELANNCKMGNILKLFNPVIDQKSRKLYITGSKTMNIGVIDMDKDELVDVFDLNAMGGFLFFDKDRLYSYGFESGHCFSVDTSARKASQVSLDTCKELAPAKSKGVSWQGYSFKETGYQSFSDGVTGFPTDWRQDLNGAYGVIEIYNRSDKKVGEIIQGPDSLYFAIDNSSGKLYSANTGDGSVSVYDLNKLKETNYCKDNSCWIKDIDVGNSADEIKVDSSGNMYVRNRLGGSVIYKYNPLEQYLKIIDNENHVPSGIGVWPTAIELSRDEKRLYALNHYGALIDVVDAGSGALISKIRFNADLKPRTDSISAMCVDKERDRLYAAWPELAVVGIADGLSGKVLGKIDLTLYGFDRGGADNSGPGLINLAVNSRLNRLYVYLYKEQKLLSFDGDSLKKLNEVPLDIKRRGEILLTSNDEKGLLYAGNKVFDAATLSRKSVFSKGDRTVAFNNSDNSVYLTDGSPSSPGKMQERVYKYTDGYLVEEWALSESAGGIPSRFHFDFRNNVFYAAYYTDALVEKFDLSAGSPVDGQEPVSGGKNSASGKCPDGICDSVEIEKGVCPEDCGK